MAKTSTQSKKESTGQGIKALLSDMPAVQFDTVALKDIKPDPNQPRKYYDEHAMQELTDSIREKGVLQPILIRPKGKGYLIVCGERRYRAAVAVQTAIKDRVTIPAVIREMDDNEALELQIIENLQRKDVHPLEEAVAFKSLKEKFTVEEIAARVAKSPKYVAKRIKLNDLIPDLQEIFFGGYIDYTDAFEISRADVEVQKEILKECAPKDWKNKKPGSWSFSNHEWILRNSSKDISGAIFKASDATLYPEMGACTKCVFNSKNDQLLFDDQRKSICNKPSCFAVKTARARKAQFEILASDPSKICITESYLGDSDKKELEAAKSAGVKVLDNKLFEYCSEEEPPMPYEKWFQEEYSYYDDDDDEKPSEIALKKEYDEYSTRQQADYDEFIENIKAGKIIKAVIVAGYSAGKEKYILLKGAAAAAEVASATGNAGDQAILNEIDGIKQREKRNKDLDAEKIWAAIRNLPADKDAQKKLFNEGLLTELEHTAAALAMYEKMCYGSKRIVDDLLGDIEGKTLRYEAYCIVLRIFTVDALATAYGTHLKRGSKNELAYKVMRQYLPTDITTIEHNQAEVADKRISRVTARINALKKKLTPSDPVTQPSKIKTKPAK